MLWMYNESTTLLQHSFLIKYQMWSKTIRERRAFEVVEMEEKKLNRAGISKCQQKIMSMSVRCPPEPEVEATHATCVTVIFSKLAQILVLKTANTDTDVTTLVQQIRIPISGDEQPLDVN